MTGEGALLGPSLRFRGLGPGTAHRLLGAWCGGPLSLHRTHSYIVGPLRGRGFRVVGPDLDVASGHGTVRFVARAAQEVQRASTQSDPEARFHCVCSTA